MLYCEKCRRNTEEDRCPECGRKKLREIREDDPCFLIERDVIWSEVVEDILKGNGIPFLSRGRMGAGLAIRGGSKLVKPVILLVLVLLAVKVISELAG